MYCKTRKLYIKCLKMIDNPHVPLDFTGNQNVLHCPAHESKLYGISLPASCVLASGFSRTPGLVIIHMYGLVHLHFTSGTAHFPYSYLMLFRTAVLPVKALLKILVYFCGVGQGQIVCGHFIVQQTCDNFRVFVTCGSFCIIIRIPK